MTDGSLPALEDYQWPEFVPGHVWLVGAGPGDPQHVTLGGLNALRQADVIVYDALVDDRILSWGRADAERIYAGKRGGKPSPKQRDISLRLIALARSGKRVLRLKGGDPYVFGRGGEEAQTLVQSGIPIRVVPGLTAGIAGLSAAGIPVTHRDVNQAVMFITGHDQSGNAPGAIDWRAVANGAPVIVLYMAIKHLAHISAQLIGAGRRVDEPVAIVSNATLGDMTVLETTLGAAADAVAVSGIAPPAIVCIGEVVSLRQTLDWAAQLRGEAPRSLDPLGVGRLDDRAVS